MVGKVPKVLVTNVLGYTFAPSILAIIPFYYIGPSLALAWIVVLWAVAGIGRLRVKLAAAVIGTILTAVAAGAIITGVGFGVKFLWVTLLDHGAITTIEKPKLNAN